jgi:hypothetical protein
MAWHFYGRAAPLTELQRIVSAGRWFFCRIEGRRRIGKTTLLWHLAQMNSDLEERLFYCQVPDSDERDVAATFRQSLLDMGSQHALALAAAVVDFPSMARAIAQLCRAGNIVVLDEFQYFTRAALSAFNSFLQAEVDQMRNAQLQRGGLFVLGSVQSEMTAILEDRAAPLYGRITHTLHLDHWDFEDLLAVFESQSLTAPSQWLTLWTFFEGVPKFYNDAFEQDLYSAQVDRFSAELLARMFLRGSSPLAEEADTWFLRELRGRVVSILHYLAEHPGCSNAELTGALNDKNDRTPLATYLAVLVNKYQMIDRRNPVFSDSKSRNARYYISDNFLQAWLMVAKPARLAARLKRTERVIEPALRRLETLEGTTFEKLIRQLHLETSRKGKGDFELSAIQLGYWNRPRDVARSIEIDVVAIDQPSKRIRFGSCKRRAAAHDEQALRTFEGHISGFMQSAEGRRVKEWSAERVLFSPEFSTATRAYLTTKGYRCLDLQDYASLLRS